MLIYPLPLAMAQEVTVNEDFTDDTYQAGLTISGGNSNAFIYTGENDSYGTTGNSLGISTGTYLFEFTEDVYEVGFMIGAVNNAYSVTWNYADDTSETENKSGQSTSDFDNMYDDFYKSFTDYNNDEANTDKFITSFAVTIGDISLLDTLYWQYDDGLTAGIGAPTNLTVSANLHSGDISIDWDAATGYQYNAERYAIGFDKANPPMYGVSTGNVGDSNALNTEYTFSKSYLQSALSATVGDTIYFKIRSDNDTNSKYSNWTTIASYTIQDVASGVTNLSISNTEYQGLDFTWTQPNTGWSAVESYKIEYKLSSEETYTSINITDANATSYTLEDISAGTYDFVVYACTQSGSWCHGPQAGPNTNFIVNQNTATTTTTIPPTLGPPMNVTVAQTYNQGVKVDWDVANSGNLTAETYELYFRTDAKNETVVYNISETEYTIPYASIPNGDYTFSVRGYSSDDNAYSSYSTEPTLTVFNQKAQDDADAAWQAEQDRLAQEEADRIAREKAEQERKAEEARIAQEKAEEEARLEAERLAELERIRLEEEEAERQRLKAIEDEKQANFAQTGYMELDTEREARELAEEQARIEEEIKNSINLSTDNSTSDGEPLTKEEEEKLEELVNVIIELQETLDPKEYEVEEEIFEIKEIIIVPTTTTTTTTTTIPIKEVIEEDEVLQEEPEFLEIEEEIVLTEEEVEILVEETEEAIAEVITIEIVEEDPIDTEGLTEEEVFEAEEKADQELTEKVEAAVAELPTEEKVKVVQAVAETKIQNLGTADKTTQKVVQAVVKEVTKVETVATLSEEQKTEVGQVLGFTEEEASEDLTIIAEQAAKDENTAQALDEFVERSIASSDVEDFTLADVVTEVQIEAFISNPVGAIIDVDFKNIEISEIGNDMTSDQKEKAQEVVVPVIIASQIIANAGALIRRPF